MTIRHRLAAALALGVILGFGPEMQFYVTAESTIGIFYIPRIWVFIAPPHGFAPGRQRYRNIESNWPIALLLAAVALGIYLFAIITAVRNSV